MNELHTLHPSRIEASQRAVHHDLRRVLRGACADGPSEQAAGRGNAGGNRASSGEPWPGQRIGIRAPGAGETALSQAEVMHAVAIGLVEDREDLIDQWPIVRRIVPAGAWGTYLPGLRRAQLWDGLVK